MKISFSTLQELRYKHFHSLTQVNEWKDALWWVGNHLSLMSFYKMGERTAKRELSNSTFEVLVKSKTKIVTEKRVKSLLPFFLREENEGYFEGNPIFEEIKKEQRITHAELINRGFSSRKVTMETAKMRKDWLILVERQGKTKTYHYWKRIQENEKRSVRIVLIELFKTFGYLTLEGISFFSGLPEYKFMGDLMLLEREGMIWRPFKLTHKKEVFALTGIMEGENEDESAMVLDDADPLVELIWIEEKKAKRNTTVLLKNGKIAATFKIRLKKSEMTISDLVWSDFPLDEVIKYLEQWGQERGYKAKIDYRQSKMGISSKDTVLFLLNKGYEKTAEGLVFTKFKKRDNEVSGMFTLERSNSWLLRHHFLEIKSEEDVFRRVMQINSLESIAFRIFKRPQLTESGMGIGIGANGRLGIMKREHLLAYATIARPSYSPTLLDEQIMALLRKYPGMSLSELQEELNMPYTKVIQRLRYLERKYQVKRLGVEILDDEFTQWEIFDYEEQFSLKQAKEYLLLELLKHQLPLTVTQISRYFGWTYQEVRKLEKDMSRRGVIETGNFISYPKNENQIAYGQVIEELRRTSVMDQEIRFLPFSDPISILYLPTEIERNPFLQPKSLSEFENGYMVFHGSLIVGYLTKEVIGDGYFANFKVLRHWTKRENIINALVRFNELNRKIWGIEGVLGKINGKSPIKMYGREIIEELDRMGIKADYLT